MGYFALKQPPLLVVVFLYSLYLIKKKSSLFIMSFMCLMVIVIRLYMIDDSKNVPLPIEGKILDVRHQGLIIKKQRKYLIKVEDTSLYQPGMVIMVYGDFTQWDESHIEHSFSYGLYLKSQKITAVIEASDIEILASKTSIHMIPYQIRQYINTRYKEQVASYLKLMVLGNKEGVDDLVQTQANDIGISHLFAISGMHLALIMMVVHKVLSGFYMRKTTHRLLILLFLLFYNIITSFSISIIRASLLFYLFLLSKDKYRKLSSMDYLSFIFIAMMVYNPYLLDHIGFQLSFFISFVILSMSRNLRVQSMFYAYLWTCIIVIVFALPIISNMNHRIGLLNAIYNPIFIIFVSVFLLPGAYLTLSLPFFSKIYSSMIKTFEKMIELSHQTNIYVDIYMGQWLFVLLYWLLLFLTFKYRKKILHLGLSWLLFFIMITHGQSLQLGSKIKIFDVNQGDAIYIQSGSCHMLIDTGHKDDYNALIHYFKHQYIRSLDALVLTHHHRDHYGEANEIIKAINVRRVMVPYYFEDIEHPQQVILSKGQEFYCGQMKLMVLNGYEIYNTENNHSIVLLGEIFDEQWLFTGDIESLIEEQLIDDINVYVDHLKVAHHGSNTSSSQSFINKIQPKNAYISYGYNQYGMPDEKVVNRLLNWSDFLYTTHTHGSIEIRYIGHFSYKVFYKDSRKTYDFN